ncbi:MAG: TonB-dependent receptor [Bacteroidales bacterium]|nr:TonB-dependent receptor [Bacteroidales bacterium]
MKKLKRLLLSLAVITMAVAAMGQGALSGTVLDEESGMALPGANIIEAGTTNGTITGADGTFELTTTAQTGKVVISFIGYTSQSISFNLDTRSNIGSISLETDAKSIDEVVVTGYGVIDVAKDRETPVAVSTIKLPQIVAKTGNQEFPDIMKNTPSVYVASQAGGYGDSRINIRGFSQENLALLFNGQPVNGMEDGKVYWSNWQGLSEIATAVQIQRGLGSSKLAISSVGATINVVTKATDMVEGGRVSAMLGNDKYMKYVASYSTGLNENGWGASFLLSHWQGDGYNYGTQGKGQTYFLSIGYKPSEKHQFNFSMTGAPQQHYQNYTKNLSAYDRDGDGEITNEEQRFNNNWGWYQGEVYSLRENFYHKPVANLNWDWNMGEKSSLSTVLYGSIGQGGGTGGYGRGYYTYDADGQLDFDQIRQNNESIVNDGLEDWHIPGRTIGSYGDNAAVRRASMNMHRWLGAVINFNHEINENLSFNLGTDFRTYYGEHFRLVDNLWGLDGYWDDNYNGAGFQDMFPGGQVYTQAHTASPYMFWTQRNGMTDDKLDYYNTERISYAGAFGQVEYKTQQLSTFFQAAVSTQGYQRFDYHSYSDADDQISEKLRHPGFNLKTGANYNINELHNVFFNAGYYSRQPFFDDLFLNYLNEVNPDVGNEGVLGLEAGYGYRSAFLDVDLNAYYTSWTDRQIRQSGDFDGDGERDDIALFENVAETHSGVELEFEVRPIQNLSIGGFASIGSWIYAGDVEARIWDEDRNPIGGASNTLYLDGVKVGDAAQTSFGLLADYKIMKGLSVDVDWRFYDRLFARIDPSSFDTADHDGSLELPSFGLVDAGISYKLYLKESRRLVFRFNANNLLNKQFISQSDTNIHPASGDAEWEGVNMDNRVYFGNGFTWNLSIAYRF